jgi:hypothetical protein
MYIFTRKWLAEREQPIYITGGKRGHRGVIGRNIYGNCTQGFGDLALKNRQRGMYTRR